MGLILSIDVGTTNIKAALVDEAGQLYGKTQKISTALESDASGRAEHDPHRLREALLEVCRRAADRHGSEIDMLALTSYMFGLVLLDQDGEPLTRISTFADTTAQAHFPRFLAAVGDVDDMYLRTGCPPIFQYPANRLHHIGVTKPQIAARTAHVLDSKAFLMHALTGEYVSDYSTANSLGCLDISGRWDEAIIRATGFAVEQFPRVLNGLTDKVPLLPAICRHLGVREGTAIAAGLYDGGAVAAAMTGFAEGIGVGNFGTSGMFRIPTPAPVEDLQGGLIQSCLLRPGRFFTGAGINNCTSATNLLLSLLGENLDYLQKTPLSTPGANGVMTFPYFTGERDMIVGNIGTGVVMGLGAASTRDDLARSFLEGVAFSYLLVKNRLDPHRQIEEFRLGGGASTNAQWMQIMADVLDLRVCVTQNPEMGIIGAACMARYGEGSDLIECSRRIMREATVFEPVARHAKIYAALAERYFSIRQALRAPLLARLGQSTD